MRKLAAAVVLPVIAAGTIASTIPAQAALPYNTIRKASPTGLTCAGTVITKKVAYLNGKPAGILTLYITSRNTGTVYACFSHTGVTKGVRLPTSVTIVGVNSRTATRPVATSTRTVVTSGTAGVVALNHAKVLTHCWAAAGTMKVGKQVVSVNSGSWCWVRKYR